MKKITFLSLIFLVSCAATAPQEPFKTGDTFLMTGTAKDGQSVSQQFTLSEKGEWEDGQWDYQADGSSRGSGLFVVDGDQKVVSFVNITELSDGQISGSEQILSCLARTNGLGWKQAHGRLLKTTKASFNRLVEEGKTKSSVEAANAMFDLTSSCIITRL